MSRLNINTHEKLNENVLKLLFDKKIYTTIDFIDSDTKFLSTITSITYKDIISIREHIIKENGGQILTGAQLYDDLLKNIKTLPTCIKSLDELLNGGLVNDNIYEFCGFHASGKTQICLTLALNFVQYHQKSVLYIDTKRDFSGKRLQEILNSRNCSEETSAKLCNEIKIKQINSHYQLIAALTELTKNSELDNIKLVIVDSIPALFYHTGDFNNTLTSINHFVNFMKYLNSKKICFVLTNILLKSNTSNVVTEKPGLGNYWSSVPHHRIKITKIDQICQLDIIKSINLESKSCQVEIDKFGVS